MVPPQRGAGCQLCPRLPTALGFQMRPPFWKTHRAICMISLLMVRFWYVFFTGSNLSSLRVLVLNFVLVSILLFGGKRHCPKLNSYGLIPIVCTFSYLPRQRSLKARRKLPWGQRLPVFWWSSFGMSEWLWPGFHVRFSPVSTSLTLSPSFRKKRCNPSNYNMTSSERGWTFYPARMLPDFAINIAGDNQSIMFFDAATCASVNKNIDVTPIAIYEHVVVCLCDACECVGRNNCRRTYPRSTFCQFGLGCLGHHLHVFLFSEPPYFFSSFFFVSTHSFYPDTRYHLTINENFQQLSANIKTERCADATVHNSFPFFYFACSFSAFWQASNPFRRFLKAVYMSTDEVSQRAKFFAPPFARSVSALHS